LFPEDVVFIVIDIISILIIVIIIFLLLFVFVEEVECLHVLFTPVSSITQFIRHVLLLFLLLFCVEHCNVQILLDAQTQHQTA
jgi:hypothetical protein